MTTLLYDGTFEGLFTAIFEVYEYKFEPVEIISLENYTTESIFSVQHEVITDQIKADRVLIKIEKNLGKKGVSQLLRVYLSENENAERLILAAVSLSLKFPNENILNNFANAENFVAGLIAVKLGSLWGYLDKEGYLFIVDRIKDVINTGGIVVASREVEEAIFTHPAVSEVAVIGMPHAKWIEAITAIVVLKADIIVSEGELIQHARLHLAAFKLPKAIIFTEALPKSTAGKILKRLLREELQA